MRQSAATFGVYVASGIASTLDAFRSYLQSLYPFSLHPVNIPLSVCGAVVESVGWCVGDDVAGCGEVAGWDVVGRQEAGYWAVWCLGYGSKDGVLGVHGPPVSLAVVVAHATNGRRRG